MKGIYRSVILIIFILLAQICKAQTNVSALFDELDHSKTNAQKIQTYKKIIDHYTSALPDSAFYYAKQGLSFAIGINDIHGQALMLSAMADMDLARGKLVSAKEEYQKVLQLYATHNAVKEQADVYRGLGSVDVAQGNYKQAIEHLLSALKIFEEAHNDHGIEEVYVSLGSVNGLLNNDNDAVRYYSKAQRIAQSIGDSTVLLKVYNNLGIMYGKRGLLDSSISYLKAGLARSEPVKYSDIRISFFDNLGTAYALKGDTATSVGYFNDALQVAIHQRWPEKSAYVYLDIAPLYFKTAPAKASDYIQRALSIAVRQGQKYAEVRAYQELSDLYGAKKQYKEAFEAIRRSYELKDSIANIARAEEIANMQSNYELNKAVKEVEDLKVQNNNTLFQKNVILLIAIATIVIFIILVLSFRRTKALNRQLTLQKNELRTANEVGTELNRQLQLQKKELKELNVVKDKVFSVIGHDLRSPLIGIVGMLQLVENDSDAVNEEYRLFFDTLKGQAQVTLDTLDKLLFWGKSSIQGVTLRQEQFATDPIVKINLDLLKNSADNKSIVLINNVDKDIHIYADLSHFDFVIRNLLSNAIKFTPFGGTVRVDAHVEPASKEVVFSVQDTGIGISEQDQKLIFDHNISGKTGTSDEKGMGIGLLLCKEFVVQNGGQLWFNSIPGKGTTFYLRLCTTPPSEFHQLEIGFSAS